MTIGWLVVDLLIYYHASQLWVIGSNLNTALYQLTQVNLNLNKLSLLADQGFVRFCFAS